MFKQRLMTSLILIPIVLLTIFYANLWALGIILFILVLICGWEWTSLIPLTNFKLQTAYLLALTLAMWLCGQFFNPWLFAGLVAWIVILIAVLTFPSSQSYWGHPLVVGGAGILLLPLFAHSLAAVFMLKAGKSLLLYILFLVWAADIGAYLAGKSFGRHKLIPQVSPGKTIEGTLGGFFLAFLVAVAGFFWFQPVSGGIWFLLAMITTAISIIGDLFVSILKRRCKMKDTGSIFPGHGGMLDRLDSLIAAIPLFYCFLKFWPPGI